MKVTASNDDSLKQHRVAVCWENLGQTDSWPSTVLSIQISRYPDGCHRDEISCNIMGIFYS